MADTTQNFANHARFRVLYHFSTLPLMLVNAIIFIVIAVKNPTGMSIWMAFVWLAVFLFAFDTRGMVVTVQDRVIRAEMMLRLERVLGPGAKEKLKALKPSHLIGLRFASDGELPALVDRVLKGELSSRKEIKQQVKEWQADWLRA